MKCRFTLVLLFVLLTSTSFWVHQPVQAAGIWYVSPAGNYSNDCKSPTTPCPSIAAALLRAAKGDIIQVAVGVYQGGSIAVVNVEQNITLSGGWNEAFSSQIGLSALDAQDVRIGVLINSDVTAEIIRFEIQNGYSDFWSGGGIDNQGTLTIRQSTIHDNLGADGGGINNHPGGDLTVVNSTIYNNQSKSGGGIKNYSSLHLINTTISHNTVLRGQSDSNGGGLFNNGSELGDVYIVNSTISGNDGAQDGGGIYSFTAYGSNLNIKNTIIAGNIADQNADCGGKIETSSYNLIGSATGCSFGSSTEDLIGIDPLLGTFGGHGGPTSTYSLYAGSPAIDTGNPQGCTDGLGILLTQDQRGAKRPQDGNGDGEMLCDRGAYEANGSEPEPPPGKTWYVHPDQKDENDCLSPITACQTIQAAADKADSRDIIRVAEGLYHGPAGQVIYVDKNLTFFGGWNADFSAQTGFSILDGETVRRGVIILDDLIVALDRFRIQNGYHTVEGGGMLVGSRAQVTLTNVEILNSIAEDKGGGISAKGPSTLILKYSTVTQNEAVGGDGGGIYGGSNLTLDNSRVNNNRAHTGGGIRWGGGKLVLSHSQVVGNQTTGSAAGIECYTADSLDAAYSIISDNISQFDDGGGIVCSMMTLDHSVVKGNHALFGSAGGVKAWELTMLNSSVSNNSANGDGGGIWVHNKLVVTNSTISGNQATGIGNGGAVYAGTNQVSLNNATIFQNTSESKAGGLYITSGARVQNTILSGNTAPSGLNCYGTIQSLGYNLIGDVSGCTFNQGAGDLFDLDARLGAPNGFPWSFPLLVGSPAIEAGNPAGCQDQQGSLLTIDTIGRLRSFDGDEDGSAICDIGASEYIPMTVLFIPIIMH